MIEIFFNQAFQNAFYDETGIINLLQIAKFDAIVESIFLPETYDPNYMQSVQKLTKRFNESVIETMHKTIEFMEEKDYDDILSYWDILNLLLY